MEALFSGYRPQTPQFKVVQSVKSRRTPRNTAVGGATEDGNSETDGVGTKPRVRSKGADPREKRTVFVGNLSPNITRRKLKQLFAQHGRVESVRLRSMVVEKGNLPVRVAKRKQQQISSTTINSYVVFAEEEGARKSLEMNGACVGDRHIRVDMATREGHAHERSVFVGGLPYDVDDEQLRVAFEKFGEVESVRVIREQKTGVGKGFGFVTFRDKSGVMFSLQNSKSAELNGKKLRVMKSKDMSVARVGGGGATAKFSGVQARPPRTGGTNKKMVEKRKMGRIGGDRERDVVRRNASQSVAPQGLEGVKPATVGGSEGGVRPSRTFHKKKEARRREREERMRIMSAQKKFRRKTTQQNFQRKNGLREQL